MPASDGGEQQGSTSWRLYETFTNEAQYGTSRDITVKRFYAFCGVRISSDFDSLISDVQVCASWHASLHMST